MPLGPPYQHVLYLLSLYFTSLTSADSHSVGYSTVPICACIVRLIMAEYGGLCEAPNCGNATRRRRWLQRPVMTNGTIPYEIVSPKSTSISVLKLRPSTLHHVLHSREHRH